VNERDERLVRGPQGERGERGERGEGMTRGARHAVVFLFVLSLVFAATNLFYTTAQVRVSNHRWCDTLTLLTARPVPKPASPAANPSRQQSYVLYTDFVRLRHQLGCG
jgi:hypothetical protein